MTENVNLEVPAKRKKTRQHIMIETNKSKEEIEEEAIKDIKRRIDKSSSKRGEMDPFDGEMPSHSCSVEFNNDVEDILKRWDSMVPKEEWSQYEEMVQHMMNQNLTSEQEFMRVLCGLQKKFKKQPRKCELLHVFNVMQQSGKIVKNHPLRDYLVKKSSKSHSGVLVITVLTSPHPKVGDQVQDFSCQWNCYYCKSKRSVEKI